MTTVYKFTDTSDTTVSADLNSSLSNYDTFGSTQTVAIPTSGTVFAHFTGTVLDAGNCGEIYFGLRISSTNYWFGSRMVNGVDSLYR